MFCPLIGKTQELDSSMSQSKKLHETTIYIYISLLPLLFANQRSGWGTVCIFLIFPIGYVTDPFEMAVGSCNTDLALVEKEVGPLTGVSLPVALHLHLTTPLGAGWSQL